MFTLFAGLLCTLLSSFLAVMILKIKSLRNVLLSTYLLSIATLTLVVSIAGLLDQLDNSTFFLFSHLLILSVTLVVWYKRRHKHSFSLKQLISSLRIKLTEILRSPILLMLLVVVIISLIFQFFLVVIMPPNSHDSMTTHMSRIGYWIQQGNFFPINTHNNFVNIYPMNPAFQSLWSIVLLGNDTFVEVSQFLSMIVCALVVYNMSMLFNKNNKNAIFNSLLFLTLPIVVLQGTTTQTDLIVAALVGCAFYFLISGFQTDRKKHLWLSGLALALALGSKQTAFFTLPGYVILASVLLFTKVDKASRFQRFRNFFLAFCICFLLFGSLTYVLNYVYFDHPLGPQSIVSGQYLIPESANVFDRFTVNSVRLFLNLVDPSGLPRPLNHYFLKARLQIFRPLLQGLNLNIEGSHLAASEHGFYLQVLPNITEDEVWFGPIGLLLVLVAFLCGIIQGFKRKDWIRVSIVISAILYLILLIFFRPGWDPYQGRYFITMIVLLLPLVNSYSSENLVPRISRILLGLLAITILINTIFLNEAKPIVEIEGIDSYYETIWEMDRIDKITIQHRGYREILRAYENLVPKGSSVGLAFSFGNWDYPFFSGDLSRRIIPVYPKTLIFDKSWILEQDLDFILFNAHRVVFEDIPSLLKYELGIGDWLFFSVQ